MQSALPAGLRCLTIEDFEPCLGENFEVRSTPVSVELRLDRLVKHSHGPGFLSRAPFSLLWSTEPHVDMVLGIYWLSIPLRQGSWGPHAVYVEPVLERGPRRMYQSVFF